VIITDEIDWSDGASLEAERKGLADAFEAWRSDWESRDTGKYLSHYAARFNSGDQDLAEWSEHKRKVNAGEELDQGRHLARVDAAVPAREIRGGQFRPGLPLEQSLQRDAQTPILDPGRRPLAHPL
jgi:hypothetical protein